MCINSSHFDRGKQPSYRTSDAGRLPVPCSPVTGGCFSHRDRAKCVELLAHSATGYYWLMNA